VISATHLIGIESKRFEPFRDAKAASFSTAITGLSGAIICSDMTQSGMRYDWVLRYRHLDAAQLVKHAYGLVTEGRRIGRKPILYYLFAEPTALGNRMSG
jgi:hypothetical protein